MQTRHMTSSFKAPAARRPDRRQSMVLMAGSCFLLLAGEASAEDLTVTTYYPSPRGVYEELRATGETRLATQTGGVVIGVDQPPASVSTKLTVSGGAAIGSGYAATAAPADGLIVEGHVGIGNDTPGNSLLAVYDMANYTGSTLTITEDIGAATGNQMVFLGAGASNLEIYGPNGVDSSGTPHNNEIFYDADGHHFRRSDLGPCCPDLVTITSAGNVGIGTTAPVLSLDVNGSAIVGSTSEEFPALSIRGGSQEGGEIILNAVGDGLPGERPTSWTLDNYPPGELFRLFYGTAGLPGNVIVLAATSTGDVGIGTTAPTQKLHVAGKATVDEPAAGQFGLINVSGSGDGATYAALDLNRRGTNETWGLQHMNGHQLNLGYYPDGAPTMVLTHQAGGGSVGIGIATPQSPAPNGQTRANLDVNDVYLRGATPPRWASEGTGTVTVQSNFGVNTSWSGLQVSCPVSAKRIACSGGGQGPTNLRNMYTRPIPPRGCVTVCTDCTDAMEVHAYCMQ